MMVIFSPVENYHPPSVCYRGQGLMLSDVPPIKSASAKVKLTGFIAREGSDIRLVYHGFYLGGRIIPDGMEKKGYEVLERIKKGRVREYFFEVMVAGKKGDESMLTAYVAEFINDLEPYLLNVVDR